MALLAGATAGPRDMSVTVWFYTVEAGLMLALLPDNAVASSLRARLLAAESAAEQEGRYSFQMLLSPLEQGLLMGAFANTSCRFVGSGRVRLQSSITDKLRELGASAEA